MCFSYYVYFSQHVVILAIRSKNIVCFVLFINYGHNTQNNVVLFRYDNGNWLHERHAPGWTNPTTEAGQPMPDLCGPSKPSSRTFI